MELPAGELIRFDLVAVILDALALLIGKDLLWKLVLTLSRLARKLTTLRILVKVCRS